MGDLSQTEVGLMEELSAFGSHLYSALNGELNSMRAEAIFYKS